MLQKLFKMIVPGANALTGIAGIAFLVIYFLEAETKQICVGYPEIGLALLYTYVMSIANRRNAQQG